MTDFTLEPIGTDDFDFRWDVYVAAIKPYIDQIFGWDDARQMEMIRSNYEEPGGHVAIVVDGDRVGIVLIEEADEAISLSQIELLPKFQGRGIGEAVIREVMARAEAAGKPVTLSVFHRNTGARRLYERLGFVAVSETERDVQMRFPPPGD